VEGDRVFSGGVLTVERGDNRVVNNDKAAHVVERQRIVICPIFFVVLGGEGAAERESISAHVASIEHQVEDLDGDGACLATVFEKHQLVAASVVDDLHAVTVDVSFFSVCLFELEAAVIVKSIQHGGEVGGVQWVKSEVSRPVFLEVPHVEVLTIRRVLKD